MRTRRLSRERGSIVAVGLAAMVPLLAGIGAIAVDLMHNNDAIGALQRAADAGALAGAQSLYTYTGSPYKSSATLSDSSNEYAVNAALAVAALNTADGHSVYTSVIPGATVTATLSPTPNPSKCTVDATMPVHSLFAGLLGNWNQTVNAHAVAGVGQTIDKMGSGFTPILVSSGQADKSGKTLSQLSMNQQFTVTLQDNSVWVYNPGQVDTQIIEFLGDPNKYAPVNESPIQIDQTIQSDNGVKSAGMKFGPLVGKTLIFPFTNDTGLGQSTPFHSVKGFFALQVTSVDPHNPDPSITGTIVPVVGPGVHLGVGSPSAFPFETQGPTPRTACLVE